MTNNGIALCRVSTAQQRLEGHSLSAQQIRINEVAGEKFDCQIDKTWSLDISSRKGKNFERKDLLEMLKYSKEHKKIKYLFVDEHDRYMRSVDEYYYWKGRFQHEANVTLVIASKPELALNPNSASLAMEFFGVWQGEVSNEERITKTTEKMQARIKAGYYPGGAHTGYQKSETPGLHVPREPEWSLLQQAMLFIIYEDYSLQQALKWLIKQGFSMPSGGKLDVYKLKIKCLDPYYAGIVTFKGWESGVGLHKPMLTEREHETLVNKLSGVKQKFIRQKNNPLFPMSNIADCEECSGSKGKIPRYVGYRNHNGKKSLEKRKYYERYMCRNCNRGLTKEDLHKQMDEILEDVRMDDEFISKLSEKMNYVWQKHNEENVSSKAKIELKIESLNKEKSNLIRSMATNPSFSDDVSEVVNQIKDEISELQKQLTDDTVTNDNFGEFVNYALHYVNDLNTNWWNLTPEKRERCKQLTFPGGILISKNKKVSTPEVSAIFKSNFDLNNSFGDPEEFKLARIIDEINRWLVLFGNFKLQKMHPNNLAGE